MMKNNPFEAQKIWDIERPPRIEVHPDLVRFQGWLYCRFNGCCSDGGNLIRSREGKIWEQVPRCRVNFQFSTTPAGQLMVIGTRLDVPPKKANGKFHWQSYTKFSDDGVNWGEDCIFPAGFESCMYQMTWHKGVAYSVGYDPAGKDGGKFFRSSDGRDWEVLTRNFFPGGRGGNEAALAFDSHGNTWCLLRGARETPVSIGYGRGPDYREWDWHVPGVDWYGDGRILNADEALRAPFGGPKFLRLNDGRLLAYGRVLGPEQGPAANQPTQRVAGGDRNDHRSSYEHASITIFEFDPERMLLTRLVDFPGYSHYCGMVEHAGRLWIACGSCGNAREVWLLNMPLPPV